MFTLNKYQVMTQERLCINCGKPIPQARIDAIEKYGSSRCNTHVDCSTVGRVAGHAIITGKNTYSELQIVSAETAQMLKDAGQRRGQSPMMGALRHRNAAISKNLHK